MPYGVYAPMIQNCMNRDSFKFVRRYIHFTDNDTRKEKNDPLLDPLYKVRGIMDKINVLHDKRVDSRTKNNDRREYDQIYGPGCYFCTVYAGKTYQTWDKGVCMLLCSYWSTSEF